MKIVRIKQESPLLRNGQIFYADADASVVITEAPLLVSRAKY